MPTLSEVVAKVTEPMLLVVQPPPVDAPPVETVPQTILPDESVVRAFDPAQEVIGVIARPEVNLPFVKVS